MPELPEVETIRRDLEDRLVNQRITKVILRMPKIAKNPSKLFVQTLEGNGFKSINRIGKLLFIELRGAKRRSNPEKSAMNSGSLRSQSSLAISEKKYLLIHLKMTGQLIYCNNGHYVAGGHSMNDQKDMPGQGQYRIGEFCLPNKHSHIQLEFADGSVLFFNDMRQFGYMKIVDEAELAKVKSRFGLDPLDAKDLNYSSLKKISGKRKINTKAVLLNQELIAGIGNIYADEILFASKVHPTRPANKLSDSEIKAIAKNAKSILEKSIRYRGTTFSDYRDSAGKKGNFVRFLKVYGRAGEKCPGCKKGIIKKIRVAGRGTHYCPACQK